MTDYGHVSPMSFTWLILGAVIFTLGPLAIAILWKIRKREPFTSILIGAATFLLFALILEKPIQNVLLFPTAMGLKEHAAAHFINAHPLLLAFLSGLFPGIFEETGRLVAYKTLLKKRTNRETSISHGIGHGGIEMILLAGISFIQYILYAAMINSGTFGTIVKQVVSLAPEQAANMKAVADAITSFSLGDLGISLAERVFSFLFHVGASILVFYACREGRRFWLYPLAVLIHTLMDFIAALYLFKLISISAWGLEVIVALVGAATFFAAYFLLYRKDVRDIHEYATVK